MPSFSDNLHRANLFRYVLPIILFLIVFSYETWEHVVQGGGSYFELHWSAEILFFGILGPTAVFFVLSFLVKILVGQNEIAVELERLNKTLEQKVAERTKKLATRNSELAGANAELQKLDKLKSDFVSLVSHELRGPLSTINGGIELALKDHQALPRESVRILEIMAIECKRLTDFVQTILDVSRIDAGKLILNLGPVAIPPLVEQAVHVVNAQTQREIVYSGTDKLPLAWADELALEKAVCNLLSNAINYSPADLPLVIDVRAANGQIDITVTDYGPGIPKVEQSRIFERFVRLESGEQSSTKGWGLGLFITKSLVEAQGGSLTVRSPAHERMTDPGAAFTISIPVIGEIIDDL